MKYNLNVDKLPANYVFGELRQKVAEYERRTGRKAIDLGVGDVKLPLFPCIIEAMKKAVCEMSEIKSFRGYPPAEGYAFLREKISENVYGGKISPDEIFITDGAKGELGNVTELFERGVKVCFPSPCYPAAAEANIALGNEAEYLVATKENDFLSFPPYGKKYDLIYLCSPSNPTGALMDEELLRSWVNYALDTKAIIIFDSAYSAFVPNGKIKSIYEVKDAERCAIEINSFSKSLGFTGVRCGYTVVPKALGKIYDIKKRLTGCRFNGVSYVSQRGAESYFSKEGLEAGRKRAEFYKTNADIIKIALKNKKMWYNNSCSSPYVFAETPDGLTSKEFCEVLLEKCGIAATAGSGFGAGGEGYVRFSAFCLRGEALETCDRLLTL